MKMQYLQKTNRGGGNEKKILWLVIFLALILVVIFLLAPQKISGGLNFLGKPFWLLKDSVLNNLNDSKNLLHSKGFLVRENIRLEKELVLNKEQLLKKNLLEKENEELKGILGRSSEKNIILARVLSKANQSPYGTLIIDVGGDEISKGQEVFSLGETIVGIIDETFAKSSRVKLISAPNTKYNIEIGAEAIPAIARGLGGGNFEIRLPRGVDVSVGDEIISPSLSIELLGIIEHIDSRPQNSFQKILFKSPTNINQLRWVIIEK